MKKTWIFLAVILTAPVLAQSTYPRDITLSWNHPTLYVDGSDIQPGDLKGTKIVCSRHDGSVAINFEVPNVGNPGDAQSYTFVGGILQPGTYTCNAFAVTVDDEQSDASNDAFIKYTGKPNPPENNSASK